MNTRTRILPAITANARVTPIGILLSNRVEHQSPEDGIRNKRIKQLAPRFAAIRMRELSDRLSTMPV